MEDFIVECANKNLTLQCIFMQLLNVHYLMKLKSSSVNYKGTKKSNFLHICGGTTFWWAKLRLIRWSACVELLSRCPQMVKTKKN